MLMKLFWCCGQHAVWDTISLSSLVKTDAEDLMSFSPMTSLSLSTLFVLLLENDPANQLALFHLTKFYEHFSLSMSICCKVILKFFFTLLISCLRLTALLYGLSCSHFHPPHFQKFPHVLFFTLLTHFEQHVHLFTGKEVEGRLLSLII